MSALLILALLPIGAIALIGWALCRAAKLGDEIEYAAWVERRNEALTKVSQPKSNGRRMR